MGKAIASELVKAGAHVSISARGEAELSKTCQELESLKQTKDQGITYVTCDVTDYKQSVHAMDEAERKLGRPIDYVFTCAGWSSSKIRPYVSDLYKPPSLALGASKPGFFLDQSIQEYELGMQLNYFGTLYTIKVGPRSGGNRIREGAIPRERRTKEEPYRGSVAPRRNHTKRNLLCHSMLLV